MTYYHELMTTIYEMLLTRHDTTQAIVTENNVLLKGNRQLMLQLNEQLKKIIASP